MGYFISILRERIANFEAPRRPPARAPEPPPRRRPSPAASRSTTCARTCATSTSTWTASARRRAARYGIVLDASLITGIDPPRGGRVGAGGHQHRPQPGLLRHQPRAGRGGPEDRAVAARGGDRDPEGPGGGGAAGGALAAQLALLKQSGPDALPAYVRNVRLGLFSKAQPRHPGGDVMIELPRRLPSLAFFGLLPSGCPSSWACCRLLRPLHHRAGAHVPGLRALRQGGGGARRAGPALALAQARAGRRSS